MPRLAEVVVPLPLEGRFHYLIPDGLELAVGHRVVVPFGGRSLTGFVLGFSDQAPPGVELKAIKERLDDEPLVDAEILELVSFAADYYQAPRGELLKIALPPGLTAASRRELRVTPDGRRALESPDLEPELREALQALVARPKGKRPSARLLDTLRARGLVTREDKLDAKVADQRVPVLARTEIPVVLAALGKARTVRAVLEALESGPVPEAEVRAHVGAAGLRRVLPGLIADGWVRRDEVTASSIALQRDGAASDAPMPHDPSRPAQLTPAQASALAALAEALDAGRPETFLLRGVTGSGKTEVYMQAIERVLARGGGALVLVPEIALTTQLEGRFVARFGRRVAVLHSGLGDAERRTHWQRLRLGDARIALGPRSAVWAPVPKLGIVVVDEEHDPSFKQQNDVRYQGRDLAQYRAHRARAVAVLGTATPSMETRWALSRGRIVELRLGERVAGRPMPAVEIVDLSSPREDSPSAGEVPILSRPLADALRSAKSRSEQAILFLNRRGFNTVVLCDECKTVRKCVRCDVGLTFHKSEAQLRCHRCEHTEPLDRPCAKCGVRAMKPFGAGTERVAEQVAREVPDVRVLRLDRDVTQKAGALEAVLGQFGRGEADVLVGTQTVTKGHDFARVTVVGIVLADASLAFPDFRSAERTFQLITQVAGRAGRHELPGRVFVQTFDPRHYAIERALAHDDEGFFELELANRRELNYPPVGRLAAVRVESKALDRAQSVVARLGEAAATLQRSRPELELRVRGPIEAPIARVQDRHRFLMLAFAPSPARLVAALRTLRERLRDLPPGVELIVDMDATDLL